jgi:N-acetylglucosamine-6-sulfatase
MWGMCSDYLCLDTYAATANRGGRLVTCLYSARSRGVLEIKKISLPLASVTLVVLLSLGLSASMPTHAEALTAKPNIVFILADDMRKDDLKYMPKTRSLLEGKGMTFQNNFVSNALCAPSRATIMRGQYSQNSGVWSNSATDSRSTTIGGWQAYQQNGDEADNVATRLQGAGYRTGLFGKYINRYANTTHIPPGWDRWFAASFLGDPRYFNYDVNDNGTIRHYGTSESDYITDVLSRQADAFISNNASQGTPFFAYVAPVAPHAPATPAPRDAHDYDGIQGPRLPSFNEADGSDKPPWIRKRPRLTSDQISAINKRHEKRIESLQAVDDLVAGLVDTLNSANAMNNTYIFFTSDNGFHHGEHRIPLEKWRPYEEDIHMPLLVRGPGVAAGSTTYKMALNTDYMPTFMDLACSSASPCDMHNWSYTPDGRSLEPVLHGGVTNWRSAVLLEASAHYSPPYRGIRTVNTNAAPKRKYVEYKDSQRELYNLDRDPYELTNVYAPSPVVDALATRLQALKTCAGEPCFTAENRP